MDDSYLFDVKRNKKKKEKKRIIKQLKSDKTTQFLAVSFRGNLRNEKKKSRPVDCQDGFRFTVEKCNLVDKL